MANESDKQKAEELKREDEDVKRALEQTAAGKPKERPKVEAKHKFWITSYVFLLVALGVLYYFARHNWFELSEDYVTLFQRFVAGAMGVILILIFQTLVKGFLIDPLTDAAARYNLDRVVNLVAYLAIFFIVLSILFANWYTAAVSL